MNRLIFVAILLLQSAAVLGQSSTNLLGSPQPPGKVSTGQSPFGQWQPGQPQFDFGSGHPGQTLTGPISKDFDCQGSSTARNRPNAPVDFGHLSNAPCAELKTQIEYLARNESAFSWSPLVAEPHFKSEPIPTQWPNAKTEQIPTRWPNLKLQPIDGRSAGLVSAHDSAK